MANDEYVAVLRRYNSEEEKYYYRSIAYADTAFQVCIFDRSYSYEENDVVFVCHTNEVTLLPYKCDHLYIFVDNELKSLDRLRRAFDVYDGVENRRNSSDLIGYMSGKNKLGASVGVDVILEALKECMIAKHIHDAMMIKKIIEILKQRDHRSMAMALEASSSLLSDEAKTTITIASRLDFSKPDVCSYAFWLSFVCRAEGKTSEYANIVRRVIPIEKFLRAAALANKV